MTQAEMLQVIETLKAQNEILKSKISLKKPGTLTCKVSPKGAVSVYGLGRLPVTLYPSAMGKTPGQGRGDQGFHRSQFRQLRLRKQIKCSITTAETAGESDSPASLSGFTIGISPETDDTGILLIR